MMSRIVWTVRMYDIWCVTYQTQTSSIAVTGLAYMSKSRKSLVKIVGGFNPFWAKIIISCDYITRNAKTKMFQSMKQKTIFEIWEMMANKRTTVSAIRKTHARMALINVHFIGKVIRSLNEHRSEFSYEPQSMFVYSSESSILEKCIIIFQVLVYNCYCFLNVLSFFGI